MRGRDDLAEGMFSYIRLEERVPKDHPLRAIRALADEVLAGLSCRFDGLYSGMGRPSIAPEMLLRATLLQAFFSVRSERQLMEQIDDNLLFRWFVGLPMDAVIWHPTVFSHNRDRLLTADVAQEFLSGLLALKQVKTLLCADHFSVDGTLIDAWASMKSFRPKDGSGTPRDPGSNGERDFHGEKRSNDTHVSTTDADARLYKKAFGQESRLCYMAHVLMENRNGLAVDATLTHATGTAEREATLVMLDRRKAKNRITLGPTKAMTPALSSRHCAPARSHHISRCRGPSPSSAKSAKPPSTHGPPATKAMPSACAAANASRRCSAGSRPKPDTTASRSEAKPASQPYSPSPLPQIT